MLRIVWGDGPRLTSTKRLHPTAEEKVKRASYQKKERRDGLGLGQGRKLS